MAYFQVTVHTVAASSVEDQITDQKAELCRNSGQLHLQSNEP